MKKYELKKWEKALSWALALPLGVWIALFVLRGGTGPWRDHIQDDARKSQRIEEAWLAEEGGGEELTALVFYPEDRSRSVFSIYRKDRMPLFGWHFRAGGGVPALDEGVAEFTAEGFHERAYVSLNPLGACRAELGNGETVALDPERPFAIVVPCGAVFYDEEGTLIESTHYGM